MKDANKQFALRGAYLMYLWRYAIQKRKQPVMVIKFKNGIRARVIIEREFPHEVPR